MDVLRDIGRLYEKGGEDLKRGLRHFDSEWSNIETGYAYAQQFAEKDREAAALCRDYCIVAPSILDLRLHPQEYVQWLESALAAAQYLRDHFAQAELLNSIGLAYARMGNTLRAINYYEQSHVIFRDLGDLRGEGKVLANLGLAYANLGYPDRALDLFNKALEIARGTGDRRKEGLELCNLGQAYYLQREFRKAIELYEQSLQIARETGHLPGENTVLNNLGKAHAVLGRTRRAITLYEQSLLIAREIGDRHGERNVLGNLGQAYHLLGEAQRAIEFYERALDLARWIGDPLAEAELLNNMGDSYLDIGDSERAVEYYQQRLKITKEIGLRRSINVEYLFHDWSLQKSLAVGDEERPVPNSAVSHLTSEDARHITWLHLSDIHFRESDSYDENIVLKSLLEDVERRVREDNLQPDFIAITGDVAFSGQKVEYEMARSFLDRLLDLTELQRDQLFIVPGNHDVDRKLITPGASAIGKALTDRNSTNAVLASPDDRRLLMARFKGYEEFFNEYFASGLSFDADRYYYVKLLELAGIRLAILGINSSWLAESDADEARRLVIGERQTRLALSDAEGYGADIRVALLHHPSEWIRGFDRGDSMALLLDKCDFVLHGHLHDASTNILSSPDSSAMVIAAGACYDTRSYPNSYSFVNLDLNSRRGTIHFRSYSDRQGGFWAKDTHLYRNVPDGVYKFDLPQRQK